MPRCLARVCASVRHWSTHLHGLTPNLLNTGHACNPWPKLPPSAASRISGTGRACSASIWSSANARRLVGVERPPARSCDLVRVDLEDHRRPRLLVEHRTPLLRAARQLTSGSSVCAEYLHCCWIDPYHPIALVAEATHERSCR